ncbi:hypothetical protein [Agrobacterium burrii]|uniref:Uncharacterized protein n=1 Tax=Agrobacterium burrii TaxID=2815339 RepID=A0ABS3EKK3_9HYPH|nr:hypothetical protein [Agrobacterium burrii]MBO0132520.1 hypothetical protein [Agrobacterium burrii]
MENQNDRFVTIATGYGLAETAVTCSFLNAYGIRTIVVPAQAASIFWHYTFAFGGMRIRVAERQSSDAELLLDSVEEAEQNTADAAQKLHWRKIAAVLVFFFFSVPPPAKGLFRHRVHPSQGYLTRASA